MATAIQRRRGTTAQHANFTGLAGEITVDTTLNTIIVHDGSTAGGIRLAKYSEVQAASEGDITAVNTNAGSGLTGGATTGAANIALDYENLSGNLVPSANNTYSLGSLTNVWKDVYIGPGSLYVNGSKVIEDSSGTIQFTADTNQNISILTTGTGDIELTTGGDIQLKSNVILTSGKSISASGGGSLIQSSNINMSSNYINNLSDPVASGDAANKNYVDSASDIVRTTGAQNVGGVKTFTDSMVISGNLTVAGTTTTVNSETVSIADNILDLNSNFTSGAPTENAGIKVKRGDSSDVQVRWNETSDVWEFTNDGSTYDPMPTDTDDLSEGSTNLYHTAARAQAEANTAIGNNTTDNLSEGSTNLYYTDARARGAISVGGDLSYDSSTGVISFTNDAGDIEGVTAGTGLTGGGTSGTVSLAVDYTSTWDGNLVPSANVTYNLGSPTARWNDLFLAGNTIHVGATTISVNASGDAEFKDSSNSSVLRKIVVDELHIGTGAGQVKLKANNGRFRQANTSDTQLSLDLSQNDTDDVAEGSTNLYYTNARVDAEIDSYLSGGTGISYASGVISLADADLISGVTAGSGLTGGGASGNVTLNIGAGSGITVNANDVALATSGVTAGTYGDAASVAQVSVDTYGRVTAASDVSISLNASAISSGTLASARLPDLTVADFGGAAIQTGSEAFSDSDTVLMTAAAVQDKIESYGYSTTVGDITAVTAGTNLNGGGTSGGVTLNLDTALTGMASASFSGTVTANLFSGTATSARYADLAEKYETDEILEAGTVVCFGGDKEVTACAHEAHHAVAGVISTDPAYMMNSDAEGQYVALAGRVPCKVVGPVAKGDLLVTSDVKGHAKADNDASAGRIIGKAIGSSDSGEAVIEVLVNMM